MLRLASTATLVLAVKHLNEWLKSWAPNTQRVYKAALNDFTESLGGVSFLNATELHCTRYVNALRRKLSPWALRHRGYVLKSIYDFLLRNKFAKENPWLIILDSIPRAKSGEIRPTKVVPFEKVLELINAPGATPDGIRDRAIFAVLFGTGVRSSELIGLRMDSLQHTDSGAVFLRLLKTKSQKIQKVAVPDFALPHLNAWIQLRKGEAPKDSDPLFTKLLGGRSCGPLTRQILRYAWGLYTKAVGIEGVSLHGARATLITKLLSDGASYREVQEVSRHASVSMVEQYDKRRFEIEEQVNRKISF